MKIKFEIPLSLALLVLAVVGCGNGEATDTAALPSQSSEARVEDATKNVESSAMSPEQKKAASDYLRQGAASAQQIEKSAQGARQGTPK